MGFVQLGNKVSIVKDIKAGCIQGSIIGPFLFSIYMSQLQSIVHPWELVAYADDSYVIVQGTDMNELKTCTEGVMSKHYEWLKSIGMICNRSKTELIVFGNNKLSVEVGGESIESKNTIKVLGILIDCDLRWTSQINRTVSKIRSLTFAMRYLRRHLSIDEIRPIIHAHVISHMAYGAPIWHRRLTFRQRAQLRSVYFKILRLITRDFNYKLSRPQLLAKCKVEHIDAILFKRESMFLFNMIHKLEPTELVSKLMQRSYLNERSLGRLHFFDFSHTKMGKACISNSANEISSKWNFDWFFLTPETFKTRLAQQLNGEI